MSDVTAVAKTTDGTPLTFPDDRQARFELGVCMVLNNWENLTTAVDNQWGGPDSEDKRDWMAGSIVELFESDYVDSDDIEDRLLNVMEDEFGVNIEDDTTINVAVQIIEMYQLCSEKNYKKLDEMYNRYLERQRNRPKATVTIQGDGADSDDESGEEEEDNDNDQMEVEAPLERTKQEPIIDEEGFELVQRKRK